MDTYQFTHDIHIRVCEDLDEAIIHALQMVGGDIHHEFLVDKHKVADMLRRSRPTAVVKDDHPFKTLYSCPNCERKIFTTENFCSRCGQALDWEGVRRC